MNQSPSLQNHSERAAAAMLGISRITLLRLRKRGEITFYRIGARVMYSAANLQAMIADLTATGPETVSAAPLE